MEITTWAQEYFQKTLSVNTSTVPFAIAGLKLYRSKKKPYLNMIQKRSRFLWAKAHLKWTVAKWKNCSVVRRIKIWSSFWKNWDAHVIRTKEDKDNPSCYQRSVQKPASLMVWVDECVWHGQLTHLERHHQCWKVYPSSRTTYAPIQTSSLSRKTLHFPTWRQCQTTYCINYNIMAA